MEKDSEANEQTAAVKENQITKKKIIPVVSDSSESSPSPEEPSSPINFSRSSTLSSRFRKSQKNNQIELENTKDKRNNSFSKYGFKLN